MQFRTKARAVDLLGKGQIADLPTAITELWKNGYDAYADNLTAEIYLEGYQSLKHPLFVMTDDGKGMSKKDIIEKWLVLGTDSKSRTKEEDEEGLETLGKKARVKAGEKGIGRLSVAFLGSPMLMLTKKTGYSLQAMFFDWRLLENYNLFLDDIQIPVCEVTDPRDFDVQFEQLKKDFLKNFEKEKDKEGNIIWELSQIDLKKKIISEVNLLEIQAFFKTEILANLIDILEHHGTKFIIFNPEPQILSLPNSEINENDSDFVRTSLAGFTNQFKKDSLSIKTAFPIHKPEGRSYDYFISSGKFFEPDDFDLADIVIEGDFNGKGDFSGKLKIYDEPINYSFSSPRRKDRRSDYGSFPIKLGYSQGSAKDSKLDEGNHDKINSKVSDYGGLYLYRDGFRVLPYGREEYDFLEFEKRRSKRAGSAFFSHRRMFGYIELSRQINPELKDKSSREGLINNAAFRAFKADMIAFFEDLAKEYFSDGAKQSIFLNKKTELNEQVKALEKDKKRELEEKKLFTRSLQEYPKKFSEYQQNYTSLLDDLERISGSNFIYSEIELLLDKIQKLDINYKDLLPKISKSYKPTETQLDRLYKYEDQLMYFNNTIKNKSEALISKVQKQLAVKELRNEFDKQFLRFNTELEDIVFTNSQQLQTTFKFIIEEYSEKANAILNDLKFNKESLSHTIQTHEDVIRSLKEIKGKFEFLREQVDRELIPLVNHIKRLRFDIDEELVQGAYKAEYENIKYQWEQTRETAQLGIAVEIIDHEFNVLYSQINSSIDKLEGKFNNYGNTDFEYLKKSFKSLEDKYSLLSPLYRISGVIAKKIKCNSIFEYLQDFFERKIKDEYIKFNASVNFLHHTLEIKEPVIHTVFINIVNNALYWLRNANEKEIFFDYFPETKEIVIVNSGVKIENHKLNKIFELFYSNRPNGRGIGLYLSKQSLNENSFDIYATNEPLYNKFDGACFVIKPI